MSSKRVFVAMSGGVDSSVAAAILKDRGFEVIGITMQIWDRSREWGGCCGTESVEDAKRVAHRLGRPHYVMNFREIFSKQVIANFYKEYCNGRTPNPCIRCNRYVKFKALLMKTMQLGGEFLATGHYARIEYDPQRGVYLLRRGVDLGKDQSYVLYTMSQEQMKRTLMPLGKLTKEMVRNIARKKNLPVAEKRESQEICFIQDKSYGEFIVDYGPDGTKPGPILNRDGKKIGEHRGIIYYTIGQRKRIGVASKEPLYVVEIDKKSNTLVVGKREEIYSDELVAEDMSYIDGEDLNAPVRVEAKIRYLHKASPAIVSPLGRNKIKVKFKSPQWAITPGQSVVFYKRDVALGGGTIL